MSRPVGELLQEPPQSTIVDKGPSVPLIVSGAVRYGHFKAVASRYKDLYNMTPRRLMTNPYTRPDFTEFFTRVVGVGNPGQPLPFQERLDVQHYPTNKNLYFFANEADVVKWFTTEITSVVMAAFNSCNQLFELSQSHEKTTFREPKATTRGNPPSPIPPEEQEMVDKSFKVFVDLRYELIHNGTRATIAVGELKAPVFAHSEWLRNQVVTERRDVEIGTELRAYAHIYKTPFIYAFDGKLLIFLRFKARNLAELKSEHCRIDSWVLTVSRDLQFFRQAVYTFVKAAWLQYNDFDRTVYDQP